MKEYFSYSDSVNSKMLYSQEDYGEKVKRDRESVLYKMVIVIYVNLVTGFLILCSLYTLLLSAYIFLLL